MRNLKQKVAFLLALVMLLSLVPTVNVFGASGVRMDGVRVRTQEPWVEENIYGVTVRFPLTRAMVPQQESATVGGFLMTSPSSIQLIHTGELNWNTHFANVRLYAVAPGGARTPLGPPAASADNQASFASQGTGITMEHFLGGFSVEVVFDVMNSHGDSRFTVQYAHIPFDAPSASEPFFTSIHTILTNNLVANPRVIAGGFSITAPNPPNLVASILPGVWQPTQPVANVVVTERTPGAFNNHETFPVRLLAPMHYEWVVTSPTIDFRGGFVRTWAQADHISIVNRFRANEPGNVDGRDTLIFQVNTARPRLPGGFAGEFAIGGLYLRPTEAHVPFPQPLNLNVRVHNLANTGGNYNNTALTVAHQTQRGVSVPEAVGTLPEIRTGGANTWTAPIRFIEAGPRALQEEFSLLASSLHPGVTIVAAQWRTHNYGAGGRDWGAGSTRATAAWGDGNLGTGTIISGGTEALFTIFRDYDGNVANLSNRRRVVEVRLQVSAEPGIEHRFDTEPVLSVNVRGIGALLEGTIDTTVDVANLRDPIVLSADTAEEIPFGEHAIGVALNQRLADVTITETAAGRLAAGQFVDVFVVPMLGGQPVQLPIGAANMAFTAPTGLIDGTNGLRLARMTTPPPSQPEHAVAAVRFNVNRASSGNPGAITLENLLLTGAMWNFPGVEFAVVIAGNSVTNRPLSGTADNVVAIPYDVVVARLVDQTPPVGPGPGPGVPGPGVEVEREVVASVPLTQLASNGTPKFDAATGMVNLRGLVEIIGSPADVTFADGISTWQQFHTNGTLTSITRAESQFTVLMDGNVMPNAMFGFQNIGNSWFVPQAAFGQLFGLLPSVEGGNLVLTR